LTTEKLKTAEQSWNDLKIHHEQVLK